MHTQAIEQRAHGRGCWCRQAWIAAPRYGGRAWNLSLARATDRHRAKGQRAGEAGGYSRPCLVYQDRAMLMRERARSKAGRGQLRAVVAAVDGVIHGFIDGGAVSRGDKQRAEEASGRASGSGRLQERRPGQTASGEAKRNKQRARQDKLALLSSLVVEGASWTRRGEERRGEVRWARGRRENSGWW